MTADPGDPDLPNLDQEWWNENWLRIMQNAIESGARVAAQDQDRFSQPKQMKRSRRSAHE